MIRFYHSVDRQVRDFVALYEGRFGIYVCGLSVQSEPYVGPRAVGRELRRAAAVADHRGFDVTSIRNSIDITKRSW